MQKKIKFVSDKDIFSSVLFLESLKNYINIANLFSK
jgi:hypothetical protein